MADDQRPVPRPHTSTDTFWPVKVFKRFVQRIDAEIIEQPQGGIEFTAAGVTKTVRTKSGSMQYSEINDNGSMMIYRPGGASRIDPAKAMASNRGFVYAAVNAIGREVMNIDWRLFEVNGKDHEELEEHDLLDLLDGVNPDMTGPELKYSLSAHLDLTGNAYWYLDGVKNETDKPKAIYPLDPSRVRVLVDYTSFPFTISGYALKLDTKEIRFQPFEILHFRLPDPGNAFEGKGFVEAAAEFIDVDTYAYEFNRKFFKNGARPAGFLKTPYKSETQLESVKMGFIDQHEGIDNMQRIGVLPDGVEWQSIGSNPKDMDFRNLSLDSRDRILAMAGVSKTILGTAESDTNRATAETADYVFSKRVVKPRMTLICSFLNEKLVSRYGDDLYISFIDPVPEDKAFRTTEMQAAVGSQPVLTVNEAREEFMGLGPVEGGDALMHPTTMATADAPEPEPQAGKPPKPAPQPSDSDEDDEEDGQKSKVMKAANGQRVAFRPMRTKLQTRAKGRKVMADDLASSVAEAVKKALAEPRKPFSTPEKDAEVYKAIRDRASQAEKEIAEAIRTINASQKAEVLENLPATRKAVWKKSKPSLFDVAAYIAVTVAALTPILTSLYKAEGKNAGEEIGKPELNPLDDAAAATALSDEIAQAADSYQTTTRNLLEAKVSAAVDAGASLDDIKAQVQDVYGYSDDARATMVAKTETFRTTNAALKATWKQSGVVQTLKWYTTSADPCVFCQSLNGKTISIDSNFLNAGDTLTVGDKTLTADYGDVGAPPCHPNCQCIARPDQVSI